MLQEGIIAGIPARELDDWTWGEMRAQIMAFCERERRKNQNFAVIAAGGARYVATYLVGKHVPDIPDVFPFWTEKECEAAKVKKYREMMERLAKGGVQNV